jgi:hypothetical protein
VLVVGAVAVAATALHSAATPDDPVDGGPSSGWTLQEMRDLTARGSGRNPVLLPRVLPDGVDETNGSFLLGNPITGPRKVAGQVWMTSYVVDALPPEHGTISGYTVYQEWLKAPAAHRPRCRSRQVDNAVLTRRVGDDLLTICLGPFPTRVARDYWRTVPFTADLGAVTWLPDPDRT